MAKNPAGMKAPPNTQPITGAEVASWFPDSRHGRPSAQCCELLANRFDLRRRLANAYPADPAEVQAAAHWPDVLRAARDLKRELARIQMVAPKILCGVTPIPPLMKCLGALVALSPPSLGGAPRSEWLEYAIEHGPAVHELLRRHSNAERRRRRLRDLPLSQNSDEGPVVAVLSRAICRVFQVEADPVQIGRALRRSAEAAKSKRARAQSSGPG